MSAWPAETQDLAKELISRYPDPKSAVMPLLYLAMKEDGYLTDDGMKEVASWTGHSPAQVQSVATFYGMFKTEPLGKYLVSVCTSISCMLLGSDDVLHAVEDEIGVPHGETDDEGVFSVEHVECLGACGHGPALQLGKHYYEFLTPEKVDTILDSLKRGVVPPADTDRELEEGS